MRPLRYTIELGEGVKAEMLFTPHLYSFKGEQGITFETDPKNAQEVFEVYADIMFAAALNAWVLDGYGTEKDFPHRRGDFHAFMTADPKAYGKALQFALSALTGKTYQELLKTSENDESGKNNGKAEPEESKKKVTRWIGRLLRRS